MRIRRKVAPLWRRILQPVENKAECGDKSCTKRWHFSVHKPGEIGTTKCSSQREIDDCEFRTRGSRGKKNDSGKTLEGRSGS